MSEKSFLSLSEEERDSFYKAKFNYFGKMSHIITIVVALSSLTYYITDCQLIGYIQTDTVLSRAIIIVPLILYLIFYPRVKSYKMKIFMTLLLVQMVHYCTLWSIVPLTNRNYVCAGALVIQISVFMTAFSASFSWAIIAQTLVIVNILVSSIFIDYDDLGMILTMNLPLCVGFYICHYWLAKSSYSRFKLQEKLEEMSYIDQLTGLYNRHKLSDYIEVNGRFKSQYNVPISMMIMDIDFFKDVNDTYGHDKGDDVLCYVGEQFSKMVDESEGICLRWGGEEFVAIMFEWDAERTCQLANRIRENIQNGDNGICGITVSIGVAVQTDRHANYRETVKNADSALYEAKHSGRNCVKVFDIQSNSC